MYAAIRRYALLPSDVPKLRQRIEERFLPLIRQVPGFVSFDLIEAVNGVVISVSVFADEAAAAGESRRATAAAVAARQTAAWLDQDAADLIRQAQQITAGEVTIHQTK